MTTILDAAARGLYLHAAPGHKITWEHECGEMVAHYHDLARIILRAAGFTDADMAAEVGSRVVVPVEPTREMVRKGRDTREGYYMACVPGGHTQEEATRQVYLAMLKVAAAPAGTEGGA